MKYLLKTIYLSILSLMLISCEGDNEEFEQTEPDLAVTIDPNTTIARTMSSTYNFHVVIESLMPSQGVDVQVIYRRNSDNAFIFTQSYHTTLSPLGILITNIPFNETGTVSVTVTSKTNQANTITKTFQLVRK